MEQVGAIVVLLEHQIKLFVLFIQRRWGIAKLERIHRPPLLKFEFTLLGQATTDSSVNPNLSEVDLWTRSTLAIPSKTSKSIIIESTLKRHLLTKKRRREYGM